jgi:hypothetical protein
MKTLLTSLCSVTNEAVDPLWDTSRHGIKDIKCECGNDAFRVIERTGAGGSGTYLKLNCTKCSKDKFLDFDNPDYEG